MRRDDRDAKTKWQTKPLWVGQLVVGGGEGFLASGVGEQRQLQLHQLPVKRFQARIRRVNLHHGRNPLHEPGAVGFRPNQPLQGVAAVGIDAGSEEEVRVSRHLLRDEFIRHVDFRPTAVQLAALVHHAVNCQHDGSADVPAAGYLFRDVSHDGAVALRQHFCAGGAEAFQVETELPTVADGLRNEASAAARADPGDVAVHVEQTRFRQRLRREIWATEKQPTTDERQHRQQ